MRDIEIYIPSSGRATVMEMITLRRLPPSLRPSLILIVPKRERRAYRPIAKHFGCQLRWTPTSIRGIASTREWILRESTAKKVLMFDDDMRFCYRPSMASPKLRNATHREMYKMIRMMVHLLDAHVLVGMSARQGNNNIDEPVKLATRQMNAHGYRRARVLRLAKFQRVPVMEDFDVTLQLLRQGYPNAVLYRFCWDQRASGAPGGCSAYRTPDVQARAARRLAKLHPGFVRVVEKTTTKTWKGLQKRTDVFIYWQKAFASAEASQ